jgi:hypothetical protein
MNEQQPTSPRRRLQELLAIPERQRTDAQWDEINELEITLASVNRVENRDSGLGRTPRRPKTAERRGAPKRPKPSGDGPGRKPFKKFQKRPPKPNP